MKLNAVGVTSSNFAKTVEFYRLLGFEFPAYGEDEQHIEPVVKPGETRLMIDAKKLIAEITGIDPKPATHSAFALECDSPDEVDLVCGNVKSAGFVVIKEPWDAFWGQRYAIIADPDGYQIDLYAKL